MTQALQRITYVEDEPDIRTIAEIALAQIGGFTLQVCESGADAVLKTPLFKPDLVLLDMMMPGMDGVETFKRLRQLPMTENTPVIFMTARAQRHETGEYKALGAIGVIPKPFDPMTLPEQINKIWQDYAARGGLAHAG